MFRSESNLQFLARANRGENPWVWRRSRLDLGRFLESGLRSSREGGAFGRGRWAHFSNSGWLSSLVEEAVAPNFKETSRCDLKTFFALATFFGDGFGNHLV